MRVASPAILVLLLGVACAGLRVGSDHDPRVDFRRLQDYAWLEEPVRERPRAPEAPPQDPFAHNSLLDQRLRAEADAALTRRGYRLVDRAEADFLLRYQIVSRELIDSSPGVIGAGYGSRHFLSGVSLYGGVQSYQQGTLVIDVIDPRTDRIAWRGWADRRSRTGHVDSQRYVAAVEHVLAGFPPED